FGFRRTHARRRGNRAADQQPVSALSPETWPGQKVSAARLQPLQAPCRTGPPAAALLILPICHASSLESLSRTTGRTGTLAVLPPGYFAALARATSCYTELDPTGPQRRIAP